MTFWIEAGANLQIIYKSTIAKWISTSKWRSSGRVWGPKEYRKRVKYALFPHRYTSDYFRNGGQSCPKVSPSSRLKTFSTITLSKILSLSSIKSLRRNSS